MNAFSGEFETNNAELASGWASALRATSLSNYRRDFSSFVKVPSPPGKGEKVADRPDEGVIRCFLCSVSPNSVVSCGVRGFTRRADALPLALGLLFIALGATAKADSTLPTVTSKTSATTVQVAEPLTLELTVTAPAGSKVVFPSIGESLGEFDVTDQVDRTDVPSAEDVQQRVWTQRLTLESIVTGDLEIPTLEIQVRGDNDIRSLRTEAIPIRVTSVLEDRADPTDFRDIQTVVDIDVPDAISRTWIWWTLGGCGGIVAAALMFIAMKKRKAWMTPSVWALRELNELRQSDAMQSSDSERVIEMMMTILRDYLELQFEIASPMQTTHEVLQAIETKNLMSAELAREFAALFENADLARFAGLRLSSGELNRTIDDAERLAGRGYE